MKQKVQKMLCALLGCVVFGGFGICADVTPVYAQSFMGAGQYAQENPQTESIPAENTQTESVQV